MSHSHLVVNHVLRQAEEYRSRRIRRDIRPDWVTRLIEDVAELFEPLEGVARVGFECRLEEDGWSVEMYLGMNETVGGPRDGQNRLVNFQFDILKLLEQFTTVERCRWETRGESTGAAEPLQHSELFVEGVISGQRLCLSIRSTPPAHLGPGLREFPNGTCEET